jgi:dienelactone hydrolase
MGRPTSWYVWAIACMLAVVGLAVAALPVTASPAGLSTEEVSFRSGDLTLHGTVWSLSRSSQPRPGIVLVHGSGSGPRAAYQPEAEAFAQAGIVALVYDKRTVGYSVLHRDYSVLAGDALAGAELLRSQPGVDPTNVGLWGESEGSWVVPLAAVRSTDVAFVVMVGASGVSPIRQQAWYLGNILRHYGVSGSMLNAVSITSLRLLASAGLFAEPNFDTVPSLEHLHQPVLAIWSASDYDHPPAEASRIVQQALHRGGNTHYTIRFLADASPDLHHSTDGYNRLDDFAPGYIDLVTTWVHQVAMGHPPAASVQPAPNQDRESQALPQLAWYESVGTELAALALFVVAFAGYPLATVARRFRGRRRAPAVRWPARMLAITGLATAVALPIYLTVPQAWLPPGPLIAGRPVPWLAFQALAVVAVACTALTMLMWSRRSPTATAGERLRLGVLMVGGIVFALWAAYWGLLVP